MSTETEQVPKINYCPICGDGNISKIGEVEDRPPVYVCHECKHLFEAECVSKPDQIEG